jgi:AP-4 complex subunit epsilon-1
MSFQQFKQELSTWLTSLGAGQVSKEFFELIKNIGEARSKQEESAIIVKESQQLKQTLAQPIDNKKKLREVLIRIVYCEMLGVPVPYAYVTALSATQEAKTSEKKVAYICASLCLRGVGEWSVLATNSLRRDLENSSILDQWAALGALSALVTRETAPALVDPTCALLQHSRALIRKWAVHAIGHFIALHEQVIGEDSTSIEEELEAGHGLWSKLLAALYDKDPAVMMAVVTVLQPLISKYGPRFSSKTRRELLSALSAIQKQVLDHHLKDYDYHRVAAPWLQISLLKIFGALGQLEANAARDLYHVLHETLNKSIAYLTQNADQASYNAAYAVLHETVNTIVRVYKHATNDRNTDALVDEAATHVSHMLTFDPKSGTTSSAQPSRARSATQDPNLKYLALHSLSDLIDINPRHVIQHQVLLFKCLNDPDDSIQRKTLELLYKMTGPKNVTLVVTKMLAHLKSSTDLYLRRDLIGKITALCEKFAPSPAWYIAAMLKCLYLGAELVQPAHLDQLLTVLQTGTGDLQQDVTLRRHAVKHAMKYLITKNGNNNKAQEQSVPDLLAQVIAWILGEYGNLLGDLEQYRHVTASDMLTDLLDRQYSRGEVRAWILMALAKRVSRDWQVAPVSSLTLETVHKYTASRHVVTQQIARDLTNLVTILNNLPRDHVIVSKLATLFDRPVRVDRKLTFLDEYTRQALRQGARDYQRAETSRDTSKSGAQTAGREQSLRFETYKAPPSTGNTSKSSGSIFEQSTAEEGKSIFSVPNTPAAVPSGPLSQASLKQVSGPWSLSGYGAATNNKSVAPVTPVTPSNSAPREALPGTATPPRASSSVKAVTPVNQQPSQEELMAALLFEGATKKTKAKKKRTPTSTNEHVTDAHSPLHTNEHVTQSSPLNTLNQGSPLNTINQGSPLNTVNQGSVDSLLSFDFTQPMVSNNNSSVSIFDAFAASPDSKELQTLIAPMAVSPNLARQLDPTHEDNFDLPNLATTPFIQTEIDGKSRSHERPQKIAADTQIQLSYFHIWQEHSLGVVLFVCNKSDAVLSDLHVTVVPPDNFAVSYRADSVVDLNRVNDHVLTINVLPPRTAVLVLIDLALSQLIFNPTLSAALTYKTSTHAADKTLKCTVPIDLPDLLRAHSMTTESFGQQWGTHTCETKLVFKNKALSLEQFEQLIRAMNFTQIKVIGKEVIGASRLVNTVPTLVLLHAKLEPQQCEVKIRAKDRALSEVVARYFTRILKQ